MKGFNKLCMLTLLLLQGSIYSQQSILTESEKDSIIKSMYVHINGNPNYVINALDSLSARKDNDSITIAHINSVLGGAYKSKSDYSRALDYMLSALKYLETTESTILHGSVTNNIGNIYLNFDLDDEALEYYLLSKEHYENNIADDSYNNYSYVLLNIAENKTERQSFSEALGYIEKAKKHLLKDTVLTSVSKKIRLAITENERANNLVMLHKLDSAKALLSNNVKILEEYNLSYPLLLGYYYLAKTYNEENNNELSLKYVVKADSIERIIDNQKYKQILSFLYSEIYKKSGNLVESYDYFKKGKKIQDSIFSTRATAAIYRLRRDLEIETEERKLMVLEKDKKIYKTKILLYVISGFAVFGITLLMITNQRNKYKKEKKITQLELERTTNTLDNKKRELTTAALQIIENGEKVKHLQKNISQLKGEIDSKYHSKLNSLSASLHVNRDKNWAAFKNRFEQVNASFFDNIKEAYPELTPNDLKLCAFLKLNFNSKDIAIFMGISHESVRISRYRLRKKMNLKRNENLACHISNF